MKKGYVKDKIRNYLEMAKGQALGRNWLRGAICSNFLITDRSLRRNIAELVVVDEVGVCNAEGGEGYFIAQTVPEIDVEIAQFESRIAHTAERIRALKRIRSRMISKQMKVEEK